MHFLHLVVASASPYLRLPLPPPRLHLGFPFPSPRRCRGLLQSLKFWQIYFTQFFCFCQIFFGNFKFLTKTNTICLAFMNLVELTFLCKIHPKGILAILDLNLWLCFFFVTLLLFVFISIFLFCFFLLFPSRPRLRKAVLFFLLCKKKQTGAKQQEVKSRLRPKPKQSRAFWKALAWFAKDKNLLFFIKRTKQL